jgi:hypothetical protein
MIQRDKQQWTEQVMNSLDNLPPAAPVRDLYGRIEQEITRVKRERVIPLRTVSAAAAVLLLLLAVNYLSIFSKHPSAKAATMEDVTKYYQLNNDYAQYGL